MLTRPGGRARCPISACPTSASSSTCCAPTCRKGCSPTPLYGGNRDKAGWRFLGHPGVWFENSAEEKLAPEPVTKGGVIQSLADVG